MQTSNQQFRTILVGLAVIGVCVVTYLRYFGGFDLPAKPPKPATQRIGTMPKSIELSAEVYERYLGKDTKSFGIPPVTRGQMAAVFPYAVFPLGENKAHTLAPGQSTKVLGMRLSLSVERLGQEAREHLVLGIENLGHKPLAYRIVTRPSSGTAACSRMRQLPHNGLALAPGITIKRAECGYRQGRTLEIVSVETVELPELGYFYLSLMNPANFGLDIRTSSLHKMPRGMACQVLQPSSLRNAIATNRVHWHDLVDFHSRHRCQTYAFPPDYKAFQEDGEHSLPVGENDL